MTALEELLKYAQDLNLTTQEQDMITKEFIYGSEKFKETHQPVLGIVGFIQYETQIDDAGLLQAATYIRSVLARNK